MHEVIAKDIIMNKLKKDTNKNGAEDAQKVITIDKNVFS